MRRLFFVFVLTVIAISLQAQDRFVGKVIDGKSSMTLDAVSVTYKTKGGLTLAFGMTDESGTFSFDAPKQRNDSAYLEIRSLGYATHTISNPKVNHEYVIKLSEEAFELKNVDVKAKKFTHSKIQPNL